MKKRLFLLTVLLVFISVLGACSKKSDGPKLFRLIVPNNWELLIGDSRSVDYAFDPSVTNRRLVWASDSAAAAVDVWGRVTAVSEGIAKITATNPDGISDSVTLHAVTTPTLSAAGLKKVDYSGIAAEYGSNLQKTVTRYPTGDAEIPAAIASVSDFTNFKSTTTADGATWAVTNYGVLRTDLSAANTRDAEQRFMGDRYFYSADTAGGKVLGIVGDGGNGIWAIMAEGVTHIQMVDMSGEDKAVLMSDSTNENVSRRGMVSEAELIDGVWKPQDSDNDGLWTSMYAAGELMKYSVLKNDPSVSSEELAAARRSAMIATEAVLLLSNITMRKGTVDAYLRYQPNGYYDAASGRYLSETALIEGGDYSLNIPMLSPADAFSIASANYLADGSKSYFLDEAYLNPYNSSSWADPREVEAQFAYRTRNLEGYVSRTYSFKDEGNSTNGFIYWSFNADGTATGVSALSETKQGYYLNGENLRGVSVDASGQIPSRLWNDLIGEGYSVDDIIYKGDTSTDEIIGHLFLYKLAYDILGAEDTELKKHNLPHGRQACPARLRQQLYADRRLRPARHVGQVQPRLLL